MGTISQMYLTTVLQYMSYQSDKYLADKAQLTLEREINKQNKG